MSGSSVVRKSRRVLGEIADEQGVDRVDRHDPRRPDRPSLRDAAKLLVPAGERRCIRRQRIPHLGG